MFKQAALSKPSSQELQKLHWQKASNGRPHGQARADKERESGHGARETPLNGRESNCVVGRVNATNERGPRNFTTELRLKHGRNLLPTVGVDQVPLLATHLDGLPGNPGSGVSHSKNAAEKPPRLSMVCAVSVRQQGIASLPQRQEVPLWFLFW